MSELKQLSVYSLGLVLTAIVGANEGFSLTVLFMLGVWFGLIGGWFLER